MISALTALLRPKRIVPVVLLSKVLFSMRAVKLLLFASSSTGVFETEACPVNILFKQSTVDVPLRVKDTPLTLLKNRLFVREIEASLGKDASIAKVVLF